MDAARSREEPHLKTRKAAVWHLERPKVPEAEGRAPLGSARGWWRFEGFPPWYQGERQAPAEEGLLAHGRWVFLHVSGSTSFIDGPGEVSIQRHLLAQHDHAAVVPGLDRRGMVPFTSATCLAGVSRMRRDRASEFVQCKSLRGLGRR